GSLLAPLLIGVALGDLLHGLPIDANQEFTGSFWDLLTPYGLFVGITIVSICVLHGATFISLKTTPGEVHDRAAHLARRAAPVTALIVFVMMTWTHLMVDEGVVPDVWEVAAVLALIAVTWLVREGREGSAFTMTTIAMATTIITIFVDLY